MMLPRKILQCGPGTPIVFLHGFLGRAEDWEPVCSFLPDCQCIGLDLPGHGNSPFREEIAIDIPRFHLVGYSMGGRIAMAYANQHPEQVVSLTVMSAHPGLKSEEEKQKRLESDQAWANLLLELPIDEFLVRWYDQSIFKPFRPNLEMRKRQDLAGLRAALMHFSLGRQPFYEIDEGIVGEWDEKFKALYKHPIVIPKAGHMVHLENPKAVSQIIHQRVSLWQQ